MPESRSPDSDGGLRASDADRDRIATRLALHCAEGRLTLDEFEGRVQQVYAARTQARLDVVLSDLPAERDATRRPRAQRTGPGVRPFSHRIELSASLDTVRSEVLEKIAPGLHRYGYELRSQSPRALVFERRIRPAWVPVAAVLAFPVGLLALAVRETQRIVISLEGHALARTILTAHGNAPRGVRKAFAELAAD